MKDPQTHAVALGREAWSLNRRALLAGLAAALLMATAIGALTYSRDRFRSAAEARGTPNAQLRSAAPARQKQAAGLEDQAATANVVVLVSLIGFALVVGLSVLTITQRIVRPARRLARAMVLMSRGDSHVRVEPEGAPEVARMGRAFNELGTALVARAQDIEEQQRALEARVAERTADLEASRLELLRRLAQAAEFRDDETHEHTERVGELAESIGRELGLRADVLERLRLAAPLHDVGKIGVADSVLRKPGKLDPEEWIAMQWHTEMGARLLAGSESPVLQMGEEIALSHHEHWDGAGYPFGLCGEEIPRSGRIVAVADVFDALIHDRPYKQAWSRAAATAYIVGNRGRQFDPAVVDAFCRVIGDPRADDLTVGGLRAS
jgi:putative two-component system response regulator